MPDTHEHWRDRVVAEHTDVFKRMERLVVFIGSPQWHGLSQMQQGLLEAQLSAMRTYARILRLRLAA